VIFNSSSAIPRHPAQVIAVSGNKLIVALTQSSFISMIVAGI
jgi:hypothetical protein